MSYLLVGDIHSQGAPLAKVLEYAKKASLRPIFLGDVFDSRCSTSNSVYVYNKVRLAEEELNAVTLNSNHQVRLRNFLNDRLEDEEYTSETWRTLREFKESGVDIHELKEWLKSKPSGFAFRDSDGRLHGCAHAYFPQKWINQMKEEPQMFYTTCEDEEEAVVWGPYSLSRRRIKWWNRNKNRSWTRCAGHYHRVVVNDSSIILDANSGFPDGKVPAYDVTKKEVVYFE